MQSRQSVRIFRKKKRAKSRLWINFVDDLFSLFMFLAFGDLFAFMFLSPTDTTETRRVRLPKILMYPILNADYTYVPLPDRKERKKQRTQHRGKPAESIPLLIHEFGLNCESDFLFLFFEIHWWPKNYAKVAVDIVCDVYLWWYSTLVTQNCTHSNPQRNKHEPNIYQNVSWMRFAFSRGSRPSNSSHRSPTHMCVRDIGAGAQTGVRCGIVFVCQKCGDERGTPETTTRHRRKKRSTYPDRHIAASRVRSWHGCRRNQIPAHSLSFDV